MNRTLFSKMTVTKFSLVFSGCLATFLIWECTTVICLVNDKVTAQPATTATTRPTATGYNATQKTEVVGSQHSFACGNVSHSCSGYCSFCEDIYGKPTMDCLSTLLEFICLPHFNDSMKSLSMTDWCVWDKVSSLYSTFSLCSEEISDCLIIPWPNSLVETMFVNIHSEYFIKCPTEEFSDPPPAIVFALVITPICLIPVMVSLVVLKTKNGDGTS
uniref:Receptor (G protein-coupled) activity modifying protein 2 n=1 Tax=Fundulus heteroclitus TaxID=8078 RepID=A0A3Q2P238_FUNHE